MELHDIETILICYGYTLDDAGSAAIKCQRINEAIKPHIISKISSEELVRGLINNETEVWATAFGFMKCGFCFSMLYGYTIETQFGVVEDTTNWPEKKKINARIEAAYRQCEAQGWL